MPINYETVEDLPDTLAIFPLPGALLLPRARMPLHIFEPRYLDMIRDALAGARLIGMIQPRDAHADLTHPEVFDIGCAGMIKEYRENIDGRFLLTLVGVCRFRIKHELNALTRYRQIQPDWQAFADDFQPVTELIQGREGFLERLHHYFDAIGVKPDWRKIEASRGEELVNFLSMGCPFTPAERQALLEAKDFSTRVQIIVTLMDMARPVGTDEADGENSPLN